MRLTGRAEDRPRLDRAPRRQRDPRRVDTDGRELELRRFGAQLLDILARGIGLEERVIDHRRDAGRRAAGRVHTDPRGAGVDDAPEPIWTTVVEHTVALTPDRRPARSHQLLNDDVDQVSELVLRHEQNHKDHKDHDEECLFFVAFVVNPFVILVIPSSLF